MNKTTPNPTYTPTPGAWRAVSSGEYRVNIQTCDDNRGYHSLVAVVHETATGKEENHMQSDAVLVVHAKQMKAVLTGLRDASTPEQVEVAKFFARDVLASITAMVAGTLPLFLLIPRWLL